MRFDSCPEFSFNLIDSIEELSRARKLTLFGDYQQALVSSYRTLELTDDINDSQLDDHGFKPEQGLESYSYLGIGDAFKQWRAKNQQAIVAESYQPITGKRCHGFLLYEAVVKEDGSVEVYIAHLGVSLPRRGVAQHLMLTLMLQYPASTKFTLVTRSFNQPAIKLYTKRLGFAEAKVDEQDVHGYSTERYTPFSRTTTAEELSQWQRVVACETAKPRCLRIFGSRPKQGELARELHASKAVETLALCQHFAEDTKKKGSSFFMTSDSMMRTHAMAALSINPKLKRYRQFLLSFMDDLNETLSGLGKLEEFKELLFGDLHQITDEQRLALRTPKQSMYGLYATGLYETRLLEIMQDTETSETYLLTSDVKRLVKMFLIDNPSVLDLFILSGDKLHNFALAYNKMMSDGKKAKGPTITQSSLLALRQKITVAELNKANEKYRTCEKKCTAEYGHGGPPKKPGCVIS